MSMQKTRMMKRRCMRRLKMDEMVVQLILENGAYVNARDRYDRTALHEASERGYEKVV